MQKFLHAAGDQGSVIIDILSVHVGVSLKDLTLGGSRVPEFVSKVYARHFGEVKSIKKYGSGQKLDQKWKRNPSFIDHFGLFVGNNRATDFRPFDTLKDLQRLTDGKFLDQWLEKK